jgi:hypothetical protein
MCLTFTLSERAQQAIPCPNIASTQSVATVTLWAQKAIRQAQRAVNGNAVELWEQRRFIERFPADDSK